MGFSFSKSSLARAVESTVLAFGWSPVIAVFGLGLTFSVFQSGAHLLRLSWQDNAVYILAIGALVLAIFEYAQRIAKRESAISVLPFFIATLSVGFAIRVAYVVNIEPEWYTDFLSYWLTGIELASSDDIMVNDIYDQRALFLTRPIIEIFGASKLALVVFNALVLSLIQVLGYDLVRRVRNHQAAQAFSVLWIAAPEPLLTTAVPNHDLAGLVLTALALWLLVVAQSTRTTKGVLLYASAAGVVLALLEVVRGLGLLFFVVVAALAFAALLVAIARQGRAALASQSLRRGGLTILLMVTSLTISLNVLSRMETTVQPATATYLAVRYTTPHSTSLSNGTHSFYSSFDKTFTRDLEHDIESFIAFRRSLVLSDFIEDPIGRIQASIARMPRQYAFGSQQNFYLRGVPGEVRRLVSVYTDFFLLGFAILLLVAIYRQANLPPRGVTIAQFLLLFVATTSMTLLLFGESQPRYLFTAWFAGAILIPYRHDSTVIATPRSPVALLFSATLALGSLALLTFALAATSLKDHNGRILSDWQFSSDLADSTAGKAFLAKLQHRSSDILTDPEGKPLPTSFGPLSLKLMLPAPPSVAHLAAAEKEVCEVSFPSQLEFQFDAPWRGKRGAFSLELEANGERVWQGILPNGDAPERVTLPLAAVDSGCVRLRFSLHSHTDQNRSSWQRASFVEVFFPRIIATE